MENSRRSREAALLVFVVFLLGVLLGGVGDHIYGHPRGQEPQVRFVTQRPKATVVKDFTDRLHLTPDQQAQLGSIIDETRARWRGLYAPLDAQHEQMRQEGRAKIRAMLTPEQLPEFDKFMQEIDQRHKEEKAQAESDR